jgi:hypothetical protein
MTFALASIAKLRTHGSLSATLRLRARLVVAVNGTRIRHDHAPEAALESVTNSLRLTTAFARRARLLKTGARVSAVEIKKAALCVTRKIAARISLPTTHVL